MKEGQLRRALAEIAREGIPDSPDLWTRLQAEFVARRPIQERRSWAGWFQHYQSAPVALLLAVLVGVVLAGAGYAALPLIQHVLSETPEGQQMLNYGETMNLSRTVNGVTVTLDFAYADRSGGLLGLTMTGPGGRALMPEQGQVRLSSSGGNSLPITSSSGTGLEGESSGSFLGFGGVGQVSEQGQVPLRLTMEALSTDGPTPHTIRGPWVFDFTAPIAPTRSVQPQQTVVVSGWPITLQNITVTPAGTWVTLRGAGPDADVELTAAGKTYHLYQDGFTGTAAIKECFARHRRCPDLWKDRAVTYVAVAMEPAGVDGKGLQEDTQTTARWIRELRTATGEWTITVRPDPSFSNPIFELEGGPWVFHTAVPDNSRA